MHTDTLELLIKARESGIPLVLVTRLASGDQSLFYKDGEIHGVGLTPSQHDLARRALQTDRCIVEEDNGNKIFFRPYNPSLRLIVVGAVHIAQALVIMARTCGFKVTLVDPRRAFATDDRFPDVTIMTEWPHDALQILNPDARTAIVTLTHDPKIDDPALETALRSDAFYIGSLGSKKTQHSRLTRLTAAGFKPEDCRRINGPVGLSIGAQSPAEIAVSIMAQIIKTLRDHQGNAV